MNPHFISDADVSRLLDYRSVVDVLDQAYQDFGSGRASVHPRTRSECANVRLSSMGGIWSDRGVAAVKVYPTLAGRFSFLVNLFDLRTNTALAVLEGNELTRFRTAAQTALIARKVAPAGAIKLALFGAGLQGRAQADALCGVFRFQEISVVDPLLDEDWCRQLARRTGATVHGCSAEEAVRGADIVVTATRSTEPVFFGQWLKPQAFVAAIGISAPKGRELDDATLDRASRVILEWSPQSMEEAGDIVLWNASSATKMGKTLDLPALYGGRAPWPNSDSCIVVFKSVGTGLADTACAYLAYQRLYASQGCAGAPQAPSNPSGEG